MKRFIGVKVIQAEAAKADKDYGQYKAGDDGYKVIYEDGYTSWSPKAVFEAAYRATDELSFGLAVEAAKKGRRIARKGWNGKGMYLAYQKAYPNGIPINKNTSEATGLPEGTVCKFLPYLMMKTVDNSFVPWLASQTDILADDWQIVD